MILTEDLFYFNAKHGVFGSFINYLEQTLKLQKLFFIYFPSLFFCSKFWFDFRILKKYFLSFKLTWTSMCFSLYLAYLSPSIWSFKQTNLCFLVHLSNLQKFSRTCRCVNILHLSSSSKIIFPEMFYDFLLIFTSKWFHHLFIDALKIILFHFQHLHWFETYLTWNVISWVVCSCKYSIKIHMFSVFKKWNKWWRFFWIWK